MAVSMVVAKQICSEAEICLALGHQPQALAFMAVGI